MLSSNSELYSLDTSDTHPLKKLWHSESLQTEPTAWGTKSPLLRIFYLDQQVSSSALRPKVIFFFNLKEILIA